MAGLYSITQIGSLLVSNFTDGNNSLAVQCGPGVWRNYGSNSVAIRRVGNQLVSYFASGAKVTAYPTGHGLWLAKSSIDVNPPPPPPPAPTGTPVKDDYPWPDRTINTMSPLRYDYRECVDFVCWRLNRDAGVTNSPWKYTWAQLRPSGGDGDAIGWRQDWQLLGWQVDVSPAAGCVGWYGTSAGALGHVNYVQSVSGGNVVLEEYNWGGNHNYNTRTVAIGSGTAPDKYLPPPP